MKLIHCCAGLFLVASCAAASGAVLVVSTTFSGPTDLYDTEQLPQFDPSLGTLQSVDFAVSAFISGSYTFDNISGGTKFTGIEYIDWQTTVNAFGGTGGNLIDDPWVTPPDSDNPDGGPPGKFNLGSTRVPVGTTLGPIPYGENYSYSNTYDPTDSEFTQFVGTGTLPVDIEVPVLFGIYFSGTGAFTNQLQTNAGMTVTATYSYSAAVPEPTTFALASLLTSGLLIRRTRRTGKLDTADNTDPLIYHGHH